MVFNTDKDFDLCGCLFASAFIFRIVRNFNDIEKLVFKTLKIANSVISGSCIGNVPNRTGRKISKKKRLQTLQ
jgi:hypothetical protein